MSPIEIQVNYVGQKGVDSMIAYVKNGVSLEPLTDQLKNVIKGVQISDDTSTIELQEGAVRDVSHTDPADKSTPKPITILKTEGVSRVILSGVGSMVELKVGNTADSGIYAVILYQRDNSDLISNR